MPDLVARLSAHLDKVEQQAVAASPGPWVPNTEHDEVLADDGEVVCEGFALSSRQLRATVDHVAAFDPLAVLGLVRATRDLVTEYEIHRDSDRCLGDKPTVEMGAQMFASGLHAGLLIAVEAVARGWGVDEDTEDKTDG